MGLDLTVRQQKDFRKNENGQNEWTTVELANLRNCWNFLDSLGLENCTTGNFEGKQLNDFLADFVESAELENEKEFINSQIEFVDNEFYEIHAWY